MRGIEALEMLNKEQRIRGKTLLRMETKIAKETAKEDVNYLIHYPSRQIF